MVYERALRMRLTRFWASAGMPRLIALLPICRHSLETGMSSNNGPGLHQILRVDEETMWQLEQEQGGFKATYPVYYCLYKSGVVRLWPPLMDEKNGIDLYWCFHGELYERLNNRRVRVRWPKVREAFRRFWRRSDPYRQHDFWRAARRLVAQARKDR